MVEVDGENWVLHVFDVEGEEDVLAVQLKIGSREEYSSFQSSFEAIFRERNGEHPGSTDCPGCRSGNRQAWILVFSGLIEDVYSRMPSPPSVVDPADVPEVVRLSMECMYSQSPSVPSSMN